MTAKQIMDGEVKWDTRARTVWDCDHATCNTTDHADWRESWVLYEDTLNARGFMTEVFREVKGNTG